MKVAPLAQWLKYDDYLLIAGPCSAESKDQVLECAHALKAMKRISIVRAGLWKPRTRPDSFAGVGELGLDWLRQASKETDLMTATEVACGQHVHQAVEGGVDILWIGARTCANPFSVQEIAHALKNYRIPVMVKNPVSADLFLWIGALERVANAGIEQLIAIHRGFSSVGATKYRNHPHWKIPLELQARFPQLPVICDPSHIAGSSELIAEISQKAIDRGMKGLMIETHPCPQRALSDANQQLSPNQLERLLNQLSFKGEFSANDRYQELLGELRGQIDIIDREIIEALSRRMEICKRIGLEKELNQVTPFQQQRLQELMSDRISFGEENQLDRELISELFSTIHSASVKIQSKAAISVRQDKQR